jgi:hypothetical protein
MAVLSWLNHLKVLLRPFLWFRDGNFWGGVVMIVNIYRLQNGIPVEMNDGITVRMNDGITVRMNDGITVEMIDGIAVGMNDI